MTAGPGSRHVQHHSGNQGMKRRKSRRMEKRRKRDRSQQEAVRPKKLQRDLQRRYRVTEINTVSTGA